MTQLRDYQEYAVNSVFKYFKSNKGNPLIAMPTGTGKSYVIAGIAKQICTTWPDQKILMLTHVKELIVQDRKALHDIWPTAPSGVFSASLSEKKLGQITFGGVATVKNYVEHFVDTDIIIVDEAHLVSPKGQTMYREIIKRLLEKKPHLKVIGLSATIYRLGQGYLTEGSDRLFTDVCCDMTDIAWFNWFIENGYMVPLVPRPMGTGFDLSNVRVTAGEYNNKDLDEAVDIDDITHEACKEIIKWGKDRKCWLVFAVSIDHSIHVMEELRRLGVNADVVHSKMPDADRDRVITALKNGNVQAVVNQNILTTGIDAPMIDLIGVLRPTKSASLWVQMLGRGTRPNLPGKENCMVLDFARNTERLGPINDPIIPQSRKAKGGGNAPVKKCKGCDCYVHLSLRVCPHCDYEFPYGAKIYTSAGTLPLIADKAKESKQIIETFAVNRVAYDPHFKNDRHSLKVTYFCGIAVFKEFIHFEGATWAKYKAAKWFVERTGLTKTPKKTHEVLKLTKNLKEPKKIVVDVAKRYPEILSYEF